MSAAPLTTAELAAALDAIGGFEVRPLLAVAVSGGPDSLALLLLADDWARRRGGVAWGLTVDHGLRPESGAEAAIVGGWLAERGIRHEILVWRGTKPAAGIQEAARDARYRLLGEWCRGHGVLHLLTAHHREDQAETHLMRRRAGSGIDGLAGMSAVRELPGCRLLRPLLAVPRARLAALLTAAGQPSLSDPSNADPRFERVRIRLETAFGGEAATAECRHCGHRRIEREPALNRLLAQAAALHPAGFAVIDLAALQGIAPEDCERLLGRVTGCIGGGRYPARRARLARLQAALMAEPRRVRTLGGCRLVPWRGRLLVMRELAAAAPPVRVDPGERVLWDRRFAAALPASAVAGLTLRPLGNQRIAEMEPVPCDVPRLVYPVLAAFHDALGLVAVPALGYRRAGVCSLPSLEFRPATPLTRAGFTVV